MTDPFHHAWQASGTDAALPPLAEVRAGADRFHRLIRRRNAIEYAASVLVIGFFGFGALTGAIHDPIARAGAWLIILGTLAVVWQLHRRASAIQPPAADAARPILIHQRAQLVRQRDALAQVGLWYLAPFAPGLALMVLAPGIRHGIGALGASAWIAVAINAAVFGGIWWLNRRAARMLQRAIDDLDALEG
ncbi:hypothetical protein OF829_08665 [Sphingomonas sp. LB-2]|uniref:hypothetical protein n=1 Tax=Sphingomonas caeni TaxID=2984949 RepID=UPI0022327558|nr:hypothetical protein [Sphingomonas caeni]MCW3847312.1 hypothetical protein [Sphingomonas caeni]